MKIKNFCWKEIQLKVLSFLEYWKLGNILKTIKTRHHVHLSSCTKSRKTNDAELRKWPNPQFWQFFDDFEVIFSTNLRPTTKKIVRTVFEKIVNVSDLGLIWRPFREYFHPNQEFFSKLQLGDFSTLIVP